jgi:hypothetical protein
MKYKLMNTNPKINFNIPSKFSHWKFVKLMAFINLLSKKEVHFWVAKDSD